MRSLQDKDLPDDGPVSLKKLFQFLHQVRMACVAVQTVHEWVVMMLLDAVSCACDLAGIISWTVVHWYLRLGLWAGGFPGC